MNRTLVLGVAAAAAVAGSLLAFNARAGDAPAGPPAPQKVIDCPLAKALVGEWNVTTSMVGEDGKAHEGKATSKVALGIGGTAMIEDYAGDMGGMPFTGHGIYKVSDDGKTMTAWWFDSFSPEPMKMTGTLGDKSMEISGTSPMGTMKIIETQVEGGFDWVGTIDGKGWMTQKFRKAK